jgi:hypothetical protein
VSEQTAVHKLGRPQASCHAAVSDLQQLPVWLRALVHPLPQPRWPAAQLMQHLHQLAQSIANQETMHSEPDRHVAMQPVVNMEGVK